MAPCHECIRHAYNAVAIGYGPTAPGSSAAKAVVSVVKAIYPRRRRPAPKPPAASPAR